MSARRTVIFVALVSLLPSVPIRASEPCTAKVAVSLEVRLMTISDVTFERIGVDFNVNPAVPSAAPADRSSSAKRQDMGLALLDDTQLSQIMEAAQGDRRSNVMQAPRLLIADGASGSIDVTDRQFFLTDVDVVNTPDGPVIHAHQKEMKFGLQVTAEPHVSADRRFVRLPLKITMTNLASSTVPLIPVDIVVPGKEADKMRMFVQQPQVQTFAIDNTLVLPDGGTALFAGMKTLVEGRNEYGPPVLSQIPYVNRLFRNVGYGRQAQSLLILVTPRIIADNEPTAVSRQARRPERLNPVQSNPGQAEIQPATLRVVAQPQATPPSCVKGPGGPVNIVAELLKAYDEACAAGRTEEADLLGRAALILNPECLRDRK